MRGAKQETRKRWRVRNTRRAARVADKTKKKDKEEAEDEVQ
jgi:hypothetical protein